MSTASRTNYLRANHIVAVIYYFFHLAFIYGFIKAWPAAACIEFGFTAKKFIAAALTHISSAIPNLLKGAAERSFGSFLSQYPEFFRA